jgi:hypothetical protein
MWTGVTIAVNASSADLDLWLGTRPRTDHTIETALATMRDLALFLH